MVTRLKTKKEMRESGEDLSNYGSSYIVEEPFLPDELDSDQANWIREPKKKKHFWNW